jgi:hypothetical protein
MRDADHTANAAVLFLRGDAVRKAKKKIADGDYPSLPALVIGGATVFVYARDGILCVSVDLDDWDWTDSPFDAYDVIGNDARMPMRLSVGDSVVFTAGADGEHYGPISR